MQMEKAEKAEQNNIDCVVVSLALAAHWDTLNNHQELYDFITPAGCSAPSFADANALCDCVEKYLAKGAAMSKELQSDLNALCEKTLLAAQSIMKRLPDMDSSPLTTFCKAVSPIRPQLLDVFDETEVVIADIKSCADKLHIDEANMVPRIKDTWFGAVA
jgi:hypothetical protein